MNNLWLATDDVLDDVRRCYDAACDFVESIKTNSPDVLSKSVRFDRDTAMIDIRGVLTKKPDAVLAYFGIEHTAYTDLIAQIEEAKKQKARRIVLRVDSGGGMVDGIYDAMIAIRDSGIKTVAHVEGVAASAAYMLASQASVIEAENPLSIVGSIGVAVTYLKWRGQYDIANTESPDKRPDVETPEGRAVVQKELDGIYNELVSMIAQGRNVNDDVVRKDYGRGAVMTAKDAKERGMIDAIVNTGKKPKPTKEIRMNIEQMKAEHPELYKAAFDAGVQEGKNQCKELMEGHLALADASGDMARAIEDIKALNAITPGCMAHHTAAGIRSAKIAQREAESVPAVEVESSTKPESESDAELSRLKKVAASFEGADTEWSN